ncbi:putative polyketide synthase [Xylariaceae sp. AK1471]|nr:putative polyketide synthase [Xylariaceae sp. AK1471]
MSTSINGAPQSEECSLEPIAICGMSCRLPGDVKSASTFWQMLVEKRTGQTPRVPDSRFNINAHYHENLERPGSFNVRGGYFLSGRPEDFDPTFFNMTPVEAQWLDPQQRKMLEVCYECLVSSGITLENAAGSSTAVFVGSFTADYQQMSTREPDFRHNYAATGVDPGIISNRIGNVFNLHGPSFTINTACSSSIYAVHNACHALRARDCNAAIVGGVNLIVTVDQHMNTAKLGILSPTSTCHTFDETADGYGRGEAAGAIYLKRLSDAIRDGDPIRGIIRSSAVNTNGKVPGMGLTHPSVKGQEAVVRMAYEKAKLDPNLTAYAELHGTGTPVGDPIEVRATSRALNDTRSLEKPLLIGAVKPNIGHSEAASGIFAVIKAALMTENAMIPGVALLNKINPEIREEAWNVKIQKDTAPWPNDEPIRRASVSSFGYGGTNGHVIIESVESLYPWYRHAKPKHTAPYNHSFKGPLLVGLSAHDKPTLKRVVADVAAVAPHYYAIDLAHTLNVHRTMFSHRAFAILREGQESSSFSETAVRSGITGTKQAAEIAFLFTGQGAQWPGMGRIAMREFPSFLDTIEKLDRVLAKLRPAPSFKLADMLRGEPEETASMISKAQVAQPLCTAVQIALVDLFSQWNIVPRVSIGHSSGEIAAAYAAGLVSAPEAIVLAFYRGVAVQQHSGKGSMLAVGLGVDQVADYLPANPDEVCIACENSPQSVTLSGKAQAIVKLREQLGASGIFARELKTGTAYHSPHMAAVSVTYDAMLQRALSTLREQDLVWRCERSDMVSSVTGKVLDVDEVLPANYWSANLRQKVRFDTAVKAMASSSAFSDVRLVVELGPHSALAGPFKQICAAAQFDRFTYIPSFVRNNDDANQLLSVAGSMFLKGYPVDLEEVNATAYAEGNNGSALKPKTQYLLVDLPPYPWNYERSHWAESRASAELRARAYPRHDLLGSRVTGLSIGSKVWRNILRHRDVPWLRDHSLGGSAIFPAAGYLSVAIEAMRQVYEAEMEQEVPVSCGTVMLRDVDIRAALVIPDNEEGVECIVRLGTTHLREWHTFAVESYVDQTWTLNCEGRIRITHPEPGLVPARERCPVDEPALVKRVSAKTWYDAFHRVGFRYGPSFQQLHHAYTDGNMHHAVGDVMVRESSGVLQGESRSIVHPATIDACLQLIMISIHAGKHKTMPWGTVPTHIEEVTLAPPDIGNGVGMPAMGRAVAWTDALNGRRFNTHAQLADSSGKVFMDMKSLTFVAFEAAVPAREREAASPLLFSVIDWKPDITKLALRSTRTWPVAETKASSCSLLELVVHRQPVANVLICGVVSEEAVDVVLDVLPSSTAVTIGHLGDKEQALSERATSRVTHQGFSSDPKCWGQECGGTRFDVVLVHKSSHGGDLDQPGAATGLQALLRDQGWLLGNSQESMHLTETRFELDGQWASQKTTGKPLQNGHIPRKSLTLLSLLTESASFQPLADALAASGFQVDTKSVTSFSSEQDTQVVIDDTNGDFLFSLGKASFEALRRVFAAGIPILWLTKGSQQGQSMTGGMAEGFLRVIRSEQAASRLALLDYSEGESLADLGPIIVELLKGADTKDSGRDAELWLHQGVLHIPRVNPNRQLDTESNIGAELSSLRAEPLPRCEALEVRLAHDQVFLKPVTQEAVLAPHMVEIQILGSEALQLNSSEILVAGKIIKAGDQFAKSEVVGKRVIAFVAGELKTVARSSVFTIVDGAGDFTHSNEELVGALRPLMRIVDLTLNRTTVQPGDQILVLPGPEFMMRLLIRLATELQWQPVIVATSDEEAGLYQSESNSGTVRVINADNSDALMRHLRNEERNDRQAVVLAHKFDALSQEIWRGMTARGRFLLLRNDESSLAPDSLPFTKGASFTTVTENSKPSLRLLELTLGLIKAHPKLLRGVFTANLEVTDIPNITTRAESSSGPDGPRRVIRYIPGHSQVKILRSSTPPRLSGNSTYLLVGCLGGLGRSLTRRMMELGARHFTFISRTGADKPEAARVIRAIHKAGASARVFRADASDEEVVRKVAAQANAERPIRGVVHAAMVLKDGMFEQMEYDAFMAAVTPKSQGAVAVHNAMQGIHGLDLDFFVMTSSISALLGNTGQSNYGAANSVLDSMARFRSANAQPAISLVLPMVLDVGVVAQNDALEVSLARKGLYGIDEDEMLRGFEVAMSHSRNLNVAESQIIMGMDPQELAAAIAATPVENLDLYWNNDPRFCHIRAAIEASQKSSATGHRNENSFSEVVSAGLKEGGYQHALECIARHIAKRVSTILMIPVDGFEFRGPSIASYGLDSMIGAEMRTWIFREFGLDYPFQKLLAPTLTFVDLAAEVARKMGIEP